METPDWNKLAGVDEAAAQPSVENRERVVRMLKDFEALDTPGRLIFALFVSIRMQAMIK